MNTASSIIIRESVNSLTDKSMVEQSKMTCFYLVTLAEIVKLMDLYNKNI